MLGADTYESFRVRTLDLKSRVRELQIVSLEVAREKVPIQSLEPCLSELRKSFSTDHIASQIICGEIDLFNSRWGDRVTPGELGSLRKFLAAIYEKLDGPYRSGIESAIIDVSYTPKLKDKTKSLINHYCSTLINDGYSREYILQEINKRFFTNDIKKVEKRTLQRFFSIFNGEKRTYIIIIPVSIAMASYIAKVFPVEGAVKALNDLPNDAKIALENQKNYDASSKYFFFVNKSVDPYTALRVTDQIIAAMVAMSYLGRRGISLEWQRYGYVKTARAKGGQIVSMSELVLQKQNTRLSKRVISELAAPADKILTQFTEESTDRLISAVNIGAISRNSSRPENQLIALWSAIEVLLSDPPKGTARIVHYVDSLAPCICIKYTRRYIVAFFDELRVHYPKHLRDFFRDEGFDLSLDQYTNFTKLLFLPEHKDLHANFCKPIANNPLALYRLWKLEQNFGTKGALYHSLKSHEQRVRWQLFRIYRTRNTIVHNGKMPSFLIPLVINVFEYFRGAMGPIMNRASIKDKKSSIDQIVAEIGFDFEIIKDVLNRSGNDEMFTPQELLRFHR
jgi:hypothetical protein